MRSRHKHLAIATERQVIGSLSCVSNYERPTVSGRVASTWLHHRHCSKEGGHAWSKLSMLKRASLSFRVEPNAVCVCVCKREPNVPWRGATERTPCTPQGLGGVSHFVRVTRQNSVVFDQLTFCQAVLPQHPSALPAVQCKKHCPFVYPNRSQQNLGVGWAITQVCFGSPITFQKQNIKHK